MGKIQGQSGIAIRIIWVEAQSSLYQPDPMNPNSPYYPYDPTDDIRSGLPLDSIVVR